MQKYKNNRLFLITKRESLKHRSECMTVRFQKRSSIMDN